MFPTHEEKIMNDAQGRTSTGKLIALVVVVAVVIAVVSTLVQNLVLGHANTAVTGGVVGAITAVVVLSSMKKKSS
jgi:multisubunit Na+/H+ antiporter MnhB subunit